MDLHPLDPPDLGVSRSLPVRVMLRSPRTVAEVLAEAKRTMDLEDAYQDWLHGRPVKIRHPRRTLRRWLADTAFRKKGTGLG